jgi:hypothetical protein
MLTWAKETTMRVRTAAAIGLTVVVLGLCTTVGAAQMPKVSITQLSTSKSFGSSGSTSVSCMSAANCIASGYASNHEATVQSERDGVWDPPVNPTKRLGKIANSILITTSCYATGCVAFGRYTKSHALNDEHFTVAYKSGQWRKATALSLRLGSAKAFQEFNISCSDQRDCVVVGTLRYSGQSASTPIYAPAVLTETSGRWGAPRPLGAPTSTVGRVAEFIDVSCPSSGNCVAVGLGSVHGTYGSIEAVETNGRWSEAEDAFPANWTVLSVACPTTRYCTVGGRISTPQGSEAFVASGRDGHWAAPVQVGRGWTVKGGSQSSVYFLSCRSAANCVAAGTVDGPRPKISGKGSISSVAWLTNETNGKWSAGTLIGYHGGKINQGQIDGLSCPTVRYCEVVGQHWIVNSSLALDGEVHSFAASFSPQVP